LLGRTPTTDNFKAPSTLPGLTLADVPDPALNALLWTLTEVDFNSKAVQLHASKLQSAMAEYMDREPRIDVTKFSRLASTGRARADHQLLTLLRSLAFKHDVLASHCTQLLDRVAAVLVTDGKTGLDVASDAMPFVLNSKLPQDAWGRV